MIEGINFYLKELKRIKPIFKNDKTASMIINQLMYYGYNQKRLEKMLNKKTLIPRNHQRSKRRCVTFVKNQ